MANEIVHGTKNERDNGFIERSIALYFDLTSPDDVRVKDSDGAVIATQTSGAVPAYARAVWSQAKLDSIDAGDGAFHIQTFWQSPGETATNLLARLQAAHSLLRTWWSDSHRSRYDNQGIVRDA